MPFDGACECVMRHRIFIRVAQHLGQAVHRFACRFGAEALQPFRHDATGRAVVLVQHQRARCRAARQFRHVQPVQRLARGALQTHAVGFEPAAFLDVAWDLPDFGGRIRPQHQLAKEAAAAGDGRQQDQRCDILDLAGGTRGESGANAHTHQCDRTDPAGLAQPAHASGDAVQPSPEAAGFVVLAARVASAIVFQP